VLLGQRPAGAGSRSPPLADQDSDGRDWFHLAPFAEAARLTPIDGGGNLITLPGRDGAI
jgi:hypothetical protein